MNSNSYNYSSQRSLCSVTDLIMTIKTSPVIYLANLSHEENKISWQFYGACTGSSRSVVVLRFIRVVMFYDNYYLFSASCPCAVRSNRLRYIWIILRNLPIYVFERRSQGWPRWPQPPQSPLRKNYKAKQLILCTTIGCSMLSTFICSMALNVLWFYKSTDPTL